MEHRTFLDALDAQKDAQDFLLATVLEGQQQGTALLLCDGQVAWTSAPETLLTQNLSALKKCTTSGVFTLGDTRVFAERFGAGARLVICGGGHVSVPVIQMGIMLGFKRRRSGWQSCWICPLPGWKIVRNMQMHCGKQGRIECSVRHLKRLWRRYRAVQRHTFVY